MLQCNANEKNKRSETKCLLSEGENERVASIISIEVIVLGRIANIVLLINVL